MPNMLRFARKSQTLSMQVVDDKLEVEEYFNNEGFSRWNKIYSESNEVNSVQLDIRSGHQQTIDKVLAWVDGEDNKKKTLCDAGCGVGSLALPAANNFKKVFASDISSSMTKEAAARAKSEGIKNAEFKVSDMEKLKGLYNTVTCIDVMIHYPTDNMYGIVDHLCSLAKDRVILSFAPKNIFYDILKKVGELFPGPSKTTRAYLHPEADVIKALKKAGFTIKRKEMTSTNFYFSRLLEAVRE
jgi:magnesium-protoporphyrin O-methyltransferase